MKKRLVKYAILMLVVLAVSLLLSIPVFAAIDTPSLGDTTGLPLIGGDVTGLDPNISLNINGEGSDAVRILLLMTILTLIPSILLLMTCFTRIVVVFSLLRNAIGLQQTPPNQVLIGLALFLSLFIMAPVIQDINENAYQPFSDGEISSQEFLSRAETPLKGFMLNQIKTEDLALFVNLSRIEVPEDPMDYPLTTVIPAFVTSELKRAFTIGFFIFIPFLIIDMVVSSALMSMGMMMLPPVMISLPFKLMLFVLVDGWGMLIRTLIATYRF